MSRRQRLRFKNFTCFPFAGASERTNPLVYNVPGIVYSHDNEELSLSITTVELQKPKLTREYMEHWFSQFQYGEPNDWEFQKRLIDTFINAVFVYDDKLVLTYNYQHGTQTITLKEVEDFLGSDLVSMSPPRRSKLYTACSDLFYKSERAHAAALPFQIEPAALGFDLGLTRT